MAIEVKVPMLPESVSDATVSTWHKKVGDKVSRDENIVDLETDKVMLEVPAPMDGVIKEIIKDTGSTVSAQEVIAIIEAADASASDKDDKKEEKSADKESAKETSKESGKEAPKAAAKEEKAEPKAAAKSDAKSASTTASEPKTSASVNASPSARRAAAEKGIDLSQQSTVVAGTRTEKSVPMTRMRMRIAERLLEVKQNTAMLTTFNEVDMSAVMALRNRYRDQFEKKYNVRLGFMSFFVRACVEALKRFPIVNASIDGNDIVYHGYFDVGVAVSTDRGLIVPVLRDADSMSMADIESKIVEAAGKARSGKLSMEEMSGGTFTITNGGVFGSLMATPIINSPQCAILGMHKIQDRAVVENGQIVIRPMMYLALSYDHRIIDGKESVSFLVAIKELLEDPTRFLLEV